MPIITPPSATHNPGRIRHRMMPYSHWNNPENGADASLYPGQIGVVVSEDGQTNEGPPTSQVYLRVGNSNSTSATNGYGQAYKVVPEDGTIIERMIASSAVTTSKINDLAVTTEKIDNSAVTTEKIADNAVTAGELGSVIAAGAGTASIGNLQISLTQVDSKGGLSIEGGLTSDIEIELSGNVTGSDKFSKDSGFTKLTINTTIQSGAVTNGMLAGSISHDKLAGDIPLSKLKKEDLLSQGTTDPTNSNTSLFYLNTTNNTLHVNKGTSLSPSWIAVVGVWVSTVI